MAHSVRAWHCISDTLEEGGFLDEKKNGEKRTGQELQNECQESKRQRGEDWKWKDELSLADSHRVAHNRLVELTSFTWQNVMKSTKSDCALVFTHEQRSTVDSERNNLTHVFLLYQFLQNSRCTVIQYILSNVATRAERLNHLSSRNISYFLLPASQMWRSADFLRFISL